MTRAKLDLSGIDDVQDAKKAAALPVLREISESAGFPSRQPSSPPAAPPSEPSLSSFRRPARNTGNRHIAINVKVDQATAERIYALRDAKPKQTIADVIEEAVQALFDRSHDSK